MLKSMSAHRRTCSVKEKTPKLVQRRREGIWYSLLCNETGRCIEFFSSIAWSSTTTVLSSTWKAEPAQRNKPLRGFSPGTLYKATQSPHTKQFYFSSLLCMISVNIDRNKSTSLVFVMKLVMSWMKLASKYLESTLFSWISSSVLVMTFHCLLVWVKLRTKGRKLNCRCGVIVEMLAHSSAESSVLRKVANW